MEENFAVVWGTLALINAAIAQSKNRNPALWLLYSLFLGPVVTGWLVLLPKVEATPEGLERGRKSEEKSGRTVLTVSVVVLLVIMVGLYLGDLLSR